MSKVKQSYRRVIAVILFFIALSCLTPMIGEVSIEIHELLFSFGTMRLPIVGLLVWLAYTVYGRGRRLPHQLTIQRTVKPEKPIQLFTLDDMVDDRIEIIPATSSIPPENPWEEPIIYGIGTGRDGMGLGLDKNEVGEGKDIEKKIIELKHRGLTVREIAAQVGKSKSSVDRTIQKVMKKT